MIDQLAYLYALDRMRKTPRSVRFTYVVAETDGGFSLKCGGDSPEFAAPSGELDSVSMTIVHPDELDLTVDFGLVVYPDNSNNTLVGIKAGDRLNATCKVRREGVDPVDIVMRVGSEEWTGLKMTATDEDVSVETTDDHVAKKEYHQQPVTCFIRDKDGEAWGAAKDSSEILNVLFEPTASLVKTYRDVYNQITGNDTYSVRAVTAKGRNRRETWIECQAEPGNPDSYRWSYQVREVGSDFELPE